MNSYETLDGNQIIEKLRIQFEDIYGKAPDKIFFAPGRVNLIGEHTDYNGGHVFPCALTLGTFAAVCTRKDKTLNLASLNIDKAAINSYQVDQFTAMKEGKWCDYPRGVFYILKEDGYDLPFGMDVLYCGNIPAGSGLSSSASIEVLTGLIIREIYEINSLSNIDLALVGQRAENNFVGMNCGIMDQFASAMGKEDHAIFLDTHTLEYQYVPLHMEGLSIVITNSMVKHELTSSGYNERRRQTEEALEILKEHVNIPSLGALSVEEFDKYKQYIKDETILMRARHAVTENQRTKAAVKFLKEKDLVAFGKLMNEAHISMQYDYDASAEEVDFLAHEAWKINGVIGSRITGGGFGGCTVSIIENKVIENFKEQIFKRYKERYGVEAKFYVVKAGDGAGISL